MITLPTLLQPKEIVNGGFTRHAPINTRMDFSLLSAHVKDAEEGWVVPVLGRDLYDDLIAKVVNSVSNYNAALEATAEKFNSAGAAPLPKYEELWVTWLLELSAWAVLYEALPFLELKVGSAGIKVLQGNLSESTGVGGVKYLQDVIKRRVHLKSEGMKDWLCDNKADYPLFDDEVCDDCKPSSEGAEGLGIYFY